MENKRKPPLKRWAAAMLGVAVVYLLLDLPIRATHAYSFPPSVGIKSFLPFSCGLFFGPAGAAGAALGAAASGLLTGAGAAECLSECLSALLVGIGIWFCWFAVYRDGHVRFERFREVGIYTLLVLAFSALAGGLTAALGGGSFLPVAGGFFVMGLLVGLLVNILLGGIFCVSPLLPSFCTPREGIPICLDPDAPHFDEVNEAIEAEAMTRGIPMKRVFEIENCLEELYLRMQKNLPEAVVRGRVDMGSTISMQIRVDGEKYDPFRSEDHEDEMDQMGLKLLRHRALRASYSYDEGQNRIHIVV